MRNSLENQMAKFVIEGRSHLQGEIEVYGAKNAAIKMIAATVLIQEKVILQNIPDILDIQVMIDILSENGAEISRDGHNLSIDTTNLTNADPNPKLVEKMRGSIVLVGPYLARFGKINIPKPGGDAIGARPLDDHLNGFKQISTEITHQDSFYRFERADFSGKIISLCPSVTATENMIMAQVLAPGQTVIKNVAREPQIVDLANFLNLAGAKISGAGTSEIKIEGVKRLEGLTYKIMPDPFETATFICMAIATQSNLKVANCNPNHLHPFLEVINRTGVKLEIGEDSVKVINTGDLRATNITADFYPGFSTDMLPQTALVLTQAEGKSEINEKLYENRLGYLKELEQMGAQIKILDSHRAQIEGPSTLKGRHIESLDIRSGATLILAGLIAEGKTVINQAENIDRGYEKIEERLVKIGAEIKRVN